MAARFNMGYVPVYGKFAWFNKSILHWEIWASAGVGVTLTEVIARDPADQNERVQEHRADAQLRPRQPLLPDGLADGQLRAARLPHHRQVRTAGPTDRTRERGDGLQGQCGTSALVNNFIAYVGMGMYLPTKFTYKTPR